MSQDVPTDMVSIIVVCVCNLLTHLFIQFKENVGHVFIDSQPLVRLPQVHNLVPPPPPPHTHTHTHTRRLVWWISPQ